MKWNNNAIMERIPGTRRAAPLEGNPNTTGAIDRTETVVDTLPAPSVTTTVTAVGSGVITGNAETFPSVVFCPNNALYVLLASPFDTMAPTEAGTEVFSA